MDAKAAADNCIPACPRLRLGRRQAKGPGRTPGPLHCET